MLPCLFHHYAMPIDVIYVVWKTVRSSSSVATPRMLLPCPVRPSRSLSITVSVSIVIAVPATFGVGGTASVHSSLATGRTPRRNHVTTVVGRSYDARSVGQSPLAGRGASRNAVLAGNGSYVPARSLVSARRQPAQWLTT